MQRLIEFLFRPPPIELPIPAGIIPGLRTTILKALEITYYRGVYDGFIGGVLLALLMLPSIRNRKGPPRCDG